MRHFALIDSGDYPGYCYITVSDNNGNCCIGYLGKNNLIKSTLTFNNNYFISCREAIAHIRKFYRVRKLSYTEIKNHSIYGVKDYYYREIQR